MKCLHYIDFVDFRRLRALRPRRQTSPQVHLRAQGPHISPCTDLATLLRLLGRGRFGPTYFVRRTSGQGCAVAMVLSSRVLRDLSVSEEIVRRLQADMRAMASFCNAEASNYVVQCLRIGTSKQGQFDLVRAHDARRSK